MKFGLAVIAGVGVIFCAGLAWADDAAPAGGVVQLAAPAAATAVTPVTSAMPAAPKSPAAPAASAVAAAQPGTTAPETTDAPPFDQVAIAQKQLDRLNETSKQLNVKLYAVESRNFILFSDLDSRVRNAILIWLEDLRQKLLVQVSLPPDQPLWDGKCLVLVFGNQDTLDAFSSKVDHHQLNRSRGYFMLEARYVGDPRLVHIATFQPIEGGNQKLREVLVHETTHAIIELYRDSVDLPLWVHEGLAEKMTVVIDPTLRPTKQAPAYQRACTNPYCSINDVLCNPFLASDLQAYGVSFSLVDYLCSVDRQGMRTFLELLKDSVEPEQALSQAFPGLNSYGELERRWKMYCLRNYLPPPADPPQKR